MIIILCATTALPDIYKQKLPFHTLNLKEIFSVAFVLPWIRSGLSQKARNLDYVSYFLSRSAIDTLRLVRKGERN